MHFLKPKKNEVGELALSNINATYMTCYKECDTGVKINGTKIRSHNQLHLYRNQVYERTRKGEIIQ